MRLLNVHTLKLERFDDAARPQYVVASHRWYDEEITKQELEAGMKQATRAYRKIKMFCRFVVRLFPDLEWVWIDTCCIDKTKADEFSEAITSMYRWYSHAAVCVAYLWDIPSVSRRWSDAEDDDVSRSTVAGDLDEATLRYVQESEWFLRGWTLSELVAPALVVLVDKKWNVIGHKDGGGQSDITCNEPLGPVLNEHIASITGIPSDSLAKHGDSLDSSSYDDVIAKLHWIHRRTTTYIEDKAYCLLGLCGISMSLRYGEQGHAMVRLLRKIRKQYPSDVMPDEQVQLPPDQNSTSSFGRSLISRAFRAQAEHNSAIETSIQYDRLYKSGLLSHEQVIGMLAEDLDSGPPRNLEGSNSTREAKELVAQRLAYVLSLPPSQRRMRWAVSHL